MTPDHGTALAPSATPNVAAGFEVDHEAVLKALDLNPRDPKTQALVLACQTYGLDPVLKHAILIQGTLYVSHKGLLHVAHASGELDGIELVDQGETGGEWWARVAVYRKDMGRPFTYVGRYPKNGSNKTYGPEMAITRAECMALRRAFDMALPVQEEQEWPQPPAGALPARSEPAAPSGPMPPLATLEERAQVNDLLGSIDAEIKSAVAEKWADVVGPSFKAVERFDTTHAAAAVALIEAESHSIFERRRKRANAEMSNVGVRGDDARHALVSEATGGETESTAQLTAAQLTAVVERCAALAEQDAGATEAVAS